MGLEYLFTATNNRMQTTDIKWECKQTEQYKKDYESSKRGRSFIPSWQIELIKYNYVNVL